MSQWKYCMVKNRDKCSNLFCNFSVMAELTNISLDSGECGLIDHWGPHCIYSTGHCWILMRRGDFFSLFSLCIDLVLNAEKNWYTQSSKRRGRDREDLTCFFLFFFRGKERFREIGREEEEGEEMWSRKTRAPCWQIGGDGHCSTENELPNLLWRFPRAPLWRSAQGCDGRNRNRPAGLRHTWPQTHTHTHKVYKYSCLSYQSILFSVAYSIYLIQWDLFF